jgi:hypothetical protein
MRRPARAAGAFALLAALAIAGGDAVASNPESPTRIFRDPVSKFSFKTFSDWNQVPLEAAGKDPVFDPVQKWMVARFAEADPAIVARFRAGAIEVFKMGKGLEGEKTGEKPGVRVINADEPKSMEELLKQILERTGGGFLPKESKEVKSKDGVPGKSWSVLRGGTFMVLAAWKKDDLEVGMWMACEGILRKRYELGFGRIVSSFTWFDEKAEDVRSLDVLNGVNISAKKRRAIEKGLVKGWDVVVSPNKNYIVIYNKKGHRNDKLAKILAERIELIRGQIYEQQFPPSEPVKTVSVVRVCGDGLEYHMYGGPYGSAGYWSSDTEELVFFDMDERKALADDDTLAVLYHEAFHQFIYYSVGEVAPHSWFNEGHGDYYAGSRYTGGQFAIKPFRWRIGIVKDAIKAGPRAMEETTDRDGETRFRFDSQSPGYSPLKALVRMSQGEYYSYPAVSYAQGWSLVYFLREIVPKNPEYSAKWGNILPTYFKVLKEEVNKARPLKPKVEEPDDGKDDPGMDEPGMDEPGMGEPGMDEPGMGEPGMDGPPAPEPPTPPGGDDDDAPTIPQFFSRFWDRDGKALKAAVTAAFAGVDFDDLESAWKKEINKIPTPPRRKR